VPTRRIAELVGPLDVDAPVSQAPSRTNGARKARR
jgi:hypothetical protein